MNLIQPFDPLLRPGASASLRDLRLFRLLAALLLLLAALPSHALTTRCVGSSLQLFQALDEARESGSNPFIIKLRKGTYLPVPALGIYAFWVTAKHQNQLIELSGGWSGPNGSCQDTSFDPTGTVISGSADWSALRVTTGGDFASNTVYLHDLSFVNTGYAKADEGACLLALVSPGNEVLADRLQFRNCIAAQGKHAALYLQNKSGLATLRNIAVSASSAANNGGIGIVNYEGGETRLNQVTTGGIASTGSDITCSGLTIESGEGAKTLVSNSLFWSDNGAHGDICANTNAGQSAIILTRVHYRLLQGAVTLSVGPSHGNPGFVSPGNLRLHPYSPLINTGIDDPIGGTGSYDARGRTRVIGAAVDVGAFEFDPADNRPPTLQGGVFEVFSNTPVNSIVLVVQATDDDRPEGGLSYTMQSPFGIALPFVLDPDSGAVRLTKALVAGAEHQFLVQACDTEPLCTPATFRLKAIAPGAGAIFSDGFDD